MKPAYVDTSFLLGIAFDEPGSGAMAARLRQFDQLFSSNLLEAEFRSALRREGGRLDPGGLLHGLNWVFPDRPLTAEFERVLAAGYLKGADLWHLACAACIVPDPAQLTFLTLDRRQKQAASALGFRT